jgi:hypothetical protein
MTYHQEAFMKKLFYTEKEVELLKRTDKLGFLEEISALKIREEERVADIVIDYKKQLHEKAVEIHKALSGLQSFEALKSTEIKAAEQAIREKFEKSILELTERCAVAEARIKEKETTSATAMKVLEDYSKVITEENKALRATLTDIAKEKAHVVTPVASPAQIVVVQPDGRQIKD